MKIIYKLKGRMIFAFLILNVLVVTTYGNSLLNLTEVVHYCNGPAGPSFGSIEFDPTDPSANLTYYWEHGAKTLNLSKLTAGLYTIHVTNNFGCSERYTIPIVDVSQCDITYQIEELGNCMMRMSIVVNGINTPTVSGDTPLGYEDASVEVFWGDGIQGGLSRVFENEAPTPISVRVRTIPEDCCTQIFGGNIVSDCSTPAAPAPKGNSSLSLLQLYKINVISYPNPIVDILNTSIISDHPEELTIRIYDILGKLIISETINTATGENYISYDLSDVADGVYLLSVHASAGQVLHTSKITKF